MIEKFEKQPKEELNTYLIIKIEIKNNLVLTESYGIANNRMGFMRNLIEKSMRMMKSVPNIVFFMTLHDGPPNHYLTHPEFSEFPIFTYASEKKEYFQVPPFILFPDFEIPSYGFQNLLRKVLYNSKNINWEKKSEIALWRGATTGQVINNQDTIETALNYTRFKLVDISNKFPHILDAKFSDYVQFDNFSMITQFVEYFGHTNRKSPSDFLSSKYLISVDGNGPTWFLNFFIFIFMFIFIFFLFIIYYFLFLFLLFFYFLFKVKTCL